MTPRPPTGPVPDAIGVASARLFAAGVDRRQRLLSLRFLGILLAGADEDGRIDCDPDDLVGLGLLHGMLPDEVDRSRAWLEAVDVLDREPTGWFIKNFSPVGDEVPPADVMAAIGRVLAKPAAAKSPAAEPQPEPQPVVVALEPARTRVARRWLAAPVGAAAAAAIVIVALTVSGQVHVPLPGRPVSNSNQTAEDAPTTASTVAGGTQASSSASPSAGSPTASSVAQAPASAARAGGPPSTKAVCPAGGVVATVERMTQEVDSSVPSSSIQADLPPIVRTSVSGVVRNTSSAAAVVSPFPVDVNFSDPAGTTSQVVTATALAGPTPIAAGASVPWSVTVENPQSAPVPGTANAHPPMWRWADAALAATCPR
jgi:hypothetical protein